MAKKGKSVTVPIIDYISRASELALQGSDWKRLTEMVNQSIALGVSADYNAIYWQNSDLSKFYALTEVGGSKNVKKNCVRDR